LWRLKNSTFELIQQILSVSLSCQRCHELFNIRLIFLWGVLGGLLDGIEVLEVIHQPYKMIMIDNES
jgi:hypothetical protein